MASSGDADDLNSSDVESEPPVNRFASAGMKSVQAILDHASELRLSSKKLLKELHATVGAPSTDSQHERWANSWRAFYGQSLKKSSDQMPTGSDIERFLLTVPDITQSKYSSSDAISWSLVKCALRSTLHVVRRQHDSFKLTYDERKTIISVFRTLQKQGKITRDPFRDPQWISVQLVSRFSRALLTCSIRFGAPNWSIRVQKCLNLILESACTGRSGDIGVTALYDAKTCLTRRWIKFKVVQVGQNHSNGSILDRVTFHVCITLPHTKSFKENGSKNKTIRLDSLDGVEFNVVDPTKFLLAHALRQGGVAGAESIEDAVANALAHPDGLIQWAFPQRPVLCAIRAYQLDFSRGASTGQALRTLNEAANLSGIMERLHSHDIRRGSARAAAEIGSSRNLGAAAESLGHSYMTMKKGITAAYVGPPKKGNFDKMLAVDAPDPFTLQGVDSRQVEMSRKRKSTPAEIDVLLQLPEYAHLLKAKRPRDMASRILRREKDKNAAEELKEQSRAAKELEEQSSTIRQPGDANGNEPSSSTNGNEGSSDPNGDESSKTTGNEGLSNESSSNTNSSSNTSHDEVSSAPIDPRLLIFTGHQNAPCSAQSLDDTAAGLSEATEHIAETLQDLIFDGDMEAPPPEAADLTVAQKELQILMAPASVFMRWLSQVNTYTTSAALIPRGAPDHLHGGSRADPTPFQHHCKNETRGCQYWSYDSSHIHRHEASCNPEKAEKLRSKAFQVRCDVKDCKFVGQGDTEALAKDRLYHHKRDTHAALDQVCDVGGHPSCQKAFTKDKLADHKLRYHVDIIRQNCPVRGCRSKTMFSQHYRLSEHLREVHKLPSNERKPILDAAKTRNVKETGADGEDNKE